MNEALMIDRAAANAVFGMTTFGASAPAADLHRHFGITSDAVAATAIALIGRGAE